MITINDWRSARSFSSTLFRQADPWPMDLENKIRQIEKMYYFINSCCEMCIDEPKFGLLLDGLFDD